MAEDRISKLPNAILQHILSSVDLKQAVQTSILSKRWKSLWTSLPNLDFNFRHLAVQSGVDLARSDQNRSFMPRFMHFVIQFLSQRDHSSNVAKFKLSSSHMAGTDSAFIEKCLDYAIKHGVQHLDIDAYCYSPPVKFPDGLFASKTLRELRLRQYIDSIVVPKSFVLPNRKTLYLETFSFNDDLYSFSREPFRAFLLRVLEIIVSGSVLFTGTTDGTDLNSESNFIQDASTIGNAKVVTLTLPTIEVIQLHLHGPVGEVTENFPNELVVFLFVEIKVLAMDPRLLEQSPSPFPYIKCLKLAKRHAIHPMKTVPRSVINYLTKASSYSDSLVVKFPDGPINSFHINQPVHQYAKYRVEFKPIFVLSIYSMASITNVHCSFVKQPRIRCNV
ncbi:UNVERIFIED_CONTAM: F-box/LRR-repeat protein [Sesamum latifolium]|uniref:F-box/LRR-repeat protein n=1 Tax=Sesamum latifolium TaxID=2727402 RepID=A0AAW2W897_9LAMI